MPSKLDENSATQRVQILATGRWIDRVNKWRFRQKPIPGISASIRRLVEIGLEAEGVEHRPEASPSGSHPGAAD